MINGKPSVTGDYFWAAHQHKLLIMVWFFPFLMFPGTLGRSLPRNMMKFDLAAHDPSNYDDVFLKTW